MKKAEFCLGCILMVMSPIALCEVGAADVVLVSNPQAAVTRADFYEEISKVPEADRFEFLFSRERIGRILQTLLIQKTLAARAREIGLDKNPIVQVKMGLAVDRALSTAFMENATKTSAVPDMQARANEVYRANPERFTTKKSIQASHILINTSSRSREEAIALAREVYQEASAGKDFGELAIKYSDDKKSLHKKGDLGAFDYETMVKEFSDAAFSMKVGQISEPVESKFGFHIIKVTGINEQSPVSFDSVKQKLIEELKKKHIDDLRTSILADAVSESKTTVNEEEIQKIKTNMPKLAE